MKQAASSSNQSGVIPYRHTGNKIEVLLVTSQRRNRWIIPKGAIESDMTAFESAAKEAYEEAGIQGRTHPSPVGEYKLYKYARVSTVKVFAMEVFIELDAWPERFIRQRQWMSIEQAANAVEQPELKQLIFGIEEWLRLLGELKTEN